MSQIYEVRVHILIAILIRFLFHFINNTCIRTMSLASLISVVSGYGLDEWGLIPGRGKVFFPCPLG